MIIVLYLAMTALLTNGFYCDEGHKRLLLHDDASLSQAYLTLAAEVKALKSAVANLQSSAGSGVGSVYVRWGKSSCPGNGTKSIYIGLAAGSSHDKTGGASNLLCLSPDPQWAHYEDGMSSGGGRVYGVEYQFGQFHSSGGASFFGGKNVYDEDAPCAVCQSPRPKMLMIPGRLDCYPGWTKEYNGYLVSDNEGHPSESEYVCLDSSPDVLMGGHTNQNGRLFYLVEGVCGSLKCPPYVEGRELTCVVCTQ